MIDVRNDFRWVDLIKTIKNGTFTGIYLIIILPSDSRSQLQEGANETVIHTYFLKEIKIEKLIILEGIKLLLLE